MGTNEATQDRPETAAEVCGQYALGDEAKKLLDEKASPEKYFVQLVQTELYRDAIQFMAHWLPKPEAVWWGCLCAWDICRDAVPLEMDEAFEAVVAWLREPNEPNRRKAQLAGKQLSMGNAAGAVAMAVFYSGGSMSLPELPNVDPPDDLFAKTVEIAVVVASQKKGAAKTEFQQRKFLRLGIDVAQGKNRWE